MSMKFERDERKFDFHDGSVKFHYLFLLLNLDFMGVCNKKSIDLPFSGIMSIAKPTLNQGDNAHGHYTVFTSLNSIPT